MVTICKAGWARKHIKILVALLASNVFSRENRLVTTGLKSLAIRAIHKVKLHKTVRAMTVIFKDVKVLLAIMAVDNLKFVGTFAAALGHSKLEAVIGSVVEVLAFRAFDPLNLRNSAAGTGEFLE